jgi:hypothetical protein
VLCRGRQQDGGLGWQAQLLVMVLLLGLNLDWDLLL